MEQDTRETIEALGELRRAIQDGLELHAQALTSPHIVFKPTLALDGNLWMALYGENLQSGIAGFGTSPQKAIDDFNANWCLDI